MELNYLKNNEKIMSDKITGLFTSVNKNINIINRELAAHKINKKYSNIMIYVYYKINEIKNIYKEYNMNPLDSVTYYTLVSQLLRYAYTAVKYLDKFTDICNIKFGQSIYEYNKLKYLLLSKLLDKYQSYHTIIQEFDPLTNMGIAAYDFLDFETDPTEDYSDITISFTCGLVRDELEAFKLNDQIPLIDEIEDILMDRFKKNKKQLKK